MSRIMQTVATGDIVPVTGYGPWLLDSNSNKFLDWFTDNGVSPLGYNDPMVNHWMLEFIKRQTPHRQPQVYQSPTAEACAQTLCVATGMDKVFFANSGAEAAEAAIKLARLYWHKRGAEGRDLILTLPNNFHGRTGLSMAAGDSATYHKRGFGAPPLGYGVLNLFNESRHYPDNGMVVYDKTIAVPWHRVAAIITAPVRGNNVVEPYAPGQMAHLRSLCDQSGSLLIFDEVQSGSGRAGWAAAFMDPTIGAIPDILCLGKGVAAGFPMSAMLARGEVADTFRPGEHFSTFGGSTNMILYIADSFMRWVQQNDVSIRAMGLTFREALAMIPGIVDVKGLGMMVAFTPDYQGYDALQLCEAAKSEGLLLVTFRRDGQIKAYPPLNIGTTDLMAGIRKLKSAMAKVRR